MTSAPADATDLPDGGAALPSLTAQAIAALVAGELVGDGGATVHAVAPLDRAGPEAVSFLGSRQYATAFARTRAGVVLVAPDLRDAEGSVAARVVVKDPHAAMLRLLPELYRAPARPAGVHETARIGRGVRLGADVAIGPYAVIGDDVTLGDRAWIGAHCVVGDAARIGDDSRLHDQVTLYPHARLGRRVIVHAGARIGSDGFGYVYQDGAHQKIPHVGGCVLEDDVEIGANTTIDRGSIDDTVIGAGTKIDNLVHIGHNVRLGRLCLVMAQVGVAGSARMADGVILAGQAGVGGHVSIGAGARVGGQAGVFGDVPAGETWSGYPARPHREALRATAATFKLAGMIKRLERLLGDAS